MTGHDSTAKPSIGDKLKGEAERMVGKAQHDPVKTAHGTELKGHPDKAEAILRTGNTDASEAAKDVRKEEKHAAGHHLPGHNAEHNHAVAEAGRPVVAPGNAAGANPQATPVVAHDAAVGRAAIN